MEDCIICSKKGAQQIGSTLKNGERTFMECLIICIPQLANDIFKDDFICSICIDRLVASTQFIEDCLLAQTKLVERKKINLINNLNNGATINEVKDVRFEEKYIVMPDNLNSISDDEEKLVDSLKDTYLLSVDQSQLHDLVPYLQEALIRENINIVSLTKDENKKKKIMLVGDTGTSTNILKHSNEDKILECIICHKRFILTNSYLLHYVKNHVKDKNEKFQKLPCVFCKNVFFQLGHFASHLNGNHKEDILNLRRQESELAKNINIDVGSPNVKLKRRSLKVSIEPKLEFSRLKENKTVFISCGGVNENLIDMGYDLNINGVENMFKMPICHTNPKRVIFVASQNVSEPLANTNSTSQNNILCIVCHKRFSDKNSYMIHLYGKHKSQCPICKCRIKKYQGGLKNHIHTNHTVDREIHKCDKCGKIFKHLSSYEYHMKAFQNTSQCYFTCEQCGDKFKMATKYQKHLWNHNNSWSCDICGLDFSSQPYLETHRHEAHNIIKSPQDGGFLCPICGKTYANQKSLSSHIAHHDYEKKKIKVMCDKCPNTFASTAGLKKHIECQHAEKMERPYCDLCDRYFSKSYSMKLHKDLYHARRPRHNCHICNEKFVRKDYLANHLRMHEKYGSDFVKRKGPTAGDKSKMKFIDKNETKIRKQTAPVLCKICNKLVGYTYFKEHYNMHMDYRPHKCQYCSAKFAVKESMKRHEKLHSDPNYKLQCRICYYKSKNEGDLKEHTKKHLKKLSYRCNLCHKMFATKRVLRLHQTNHPELEKKKEEIIEKALENIIQVVPEGKEHEYYSNKVEKTPQNVIDEEVRVFQNLVKEFREEL